MAGFQQFAWFLVELDWKFSYETRLSATNADKHFLFLQ